MPDNYTKSKKIAQNTILLYIRMFAVMVITLYAVRLVIDALGVEGYGVYNVVAGIISFVGFISSSLSSATQRFFSYAIGEENKDKQVEVFSASFFIFIIFSIVFVLLSEALGLWLIYNKLVIPEEMLHTANWVFQFSVFSFVCSVLSIPFIAVIIANEKMGIYAIVTVVECLLKFGAALMITMSHGNRLFLYGFLLFGAHLFVFLLYVGIAKNKFFDVCKVKKLGNKDTLKSLVSFSGWSLFGNAAGVCINQGNTILVNIFFGPVVNASRAVALQISNTLASLCGNFSMAVKPPIVKSYAQENYSYLLNVFYFSNKFIYYGMLMICIPLFLEVETVLSLWIKTYTADMILFTRIILIYTILMVLHEPITIIVQATGKVKYYYILAESFTLLCMPATYLFYKMGYPAETTFVIMCVAILLSHIIRLIVLRKLFPLFRMSKYIKSFVLPAVFLTPIIFVGSYLTSSNIENNIARLITDIIVTVSLTIIMVYFFAISAKEKDLLKSSIIK